MCFVILVWNFLIEASRDEDVNRERGSSEVKVVCRTAALKLFL